MKQTTTQRELKHTKSPMLVSLAYYSYLSGGIIANSAVVSMGGMYWTSHRPISDADCMFINNAAIELTGTSPEEVAAIRNA